MGISHATRKRSQPFEVSITSLLPLLRHQAHNVATTKYAMGRSRETVAFLSPRQTSVITADQPLYSLLKQFQWTWPEYGEEKNVIIGELHIEIAALRSVGFLLEGSDRTSAIVEAGLAQMELQISSQTSFLLR